jgi:hypothetical protein
LYEFGTKRYLHALSFLDAHRVGIAIALLAGGAAFLVAARIFGWRVAITGVGLFFFSTGRALDRVMIGEDLSELEWSWGTTVVFVILGLLVGTCAVFRRDLDQWLERQALDEILFLGFVTACVLSMPSLPQN